MAKKAIITDYPGNVRVMSNIRNNIGIPFFNQNDTVTATRVTTWYDGTPMDDSKADGKVYLKHTSSGDYYRVNLPNDGELFLEKDTVAQLRSMSAVEILLLKMGYYKGVTLNGYYNANDTPGAIQYYLSDTTQEDDGGSVFEVGGIKLEHEFVGEVDVRYFGAKSEDPAFDNAPVINTCIDLISIKGEGTVVIPTGVYYVKITEPSDGTQTEKDFVNCIIMKSNVNLKIEGSLHLANSNRIRYGIISIYNISNVNIFGSGSIKGDMVVNPQNSGEWGHGIFVYDSSFINVRDIKINECFGDGIYLGGTAGATAPQNIFNIKIDFCEVYNNRRQGISITKGFNVSVDSCSIHSTGRTRGTAPMAGIDIEPNNFQTVENVSIKNNHIYGNSGVQIGIYSLTSNAKSKTIDISNNKISDFGKQSGDFESTLLHMAANVNLESAECSGAVINSNTIDVNNTFTSIVFNITNNSESVLISNNIITPATMKDDLSCVRIVRAKSVTITNNKVKNVNTFAITTGGLSYDINITNNSLTNVRRGGSIGSTRRGRISDNYINNLSLKDEANDNIFLTCFGARDFEINHNTLEYVKNTGIRLSEGSNRNIIYNNVFLNSCWNNSATYAVQITGTSASFSYDNDVSSNTFSITDPDIGLIFQSTFFINYTNNSRRGFVRPNIIENTVGASVEEYTLSISSQVLYIPNLRSSSPVSDVSTTPPSPLSAQTVTTIEEAQTAINNLVTMVNALQANEVELKAKLNAKLVADRASGQQSTT